MSTTTTPTVAQIIADQIGRRAFFMLGAKELVGGENYLQFRISGCRTISHIKITLDPSDTYTMSFLKWSGKKLEYKVVAELSGVYCDMIHDVIESKTGLYTSM